MSAALPFAQHGALTRGSHAAGSRVPAMCLSATSPCGPSRSPGPRAALAACLHLHTTRL